MIKLYLDEDTHKKIAVALRLKGYDVISAHEVKNWEISDREQLIYAISEERAIFTFNVGDFSKIQKEYKDSNQNHFGIILSKQIPLKDVLVKLLEFLYDKSSKEIKDNIFWI